MATPIYHITHIDNLATIIRANGLWCDAQRTQQRFECVGIAHQTLKERRARTLVRKQSGQQVAAGGSLADYVPFYFANRSPMLYSIHTGSVVGYRGAQTDIVYLVSGVDVVAQGHRRWCFTNGHAVEAMTEFYDDLTDLKEVDWAVVNHWSWKNTNADPDRKRRKQAELLVHGSFPWSWIQQVGVSNAVMQRRVEAVVAAENPAHRPAVAIRRKWYYGGC